MQINVVLVEMKDMLVYMSQILDYFGDFVVNM